jgi:hypothetical protein
MNTFKKTVLAVVISVILFFVISTILLTLTGLTKPSGIIEPYWDMDSNFYAARKTTFMGGDYVFFYVSEFKDNPKAYCVMGQRMSTRNVLNGVEIDDLNVDNQTFMSGLIFWYYDGEKIQQRTSQAVNYVGNDSLVIKSNNSELVLNGNYPFYRFSYTGPEFNTSARILDAGLGSLKTFEANLDNTQLKLVGNGSAKVIKTSLDDEFKYYNTTMRLVDAGKNGYSIAHFSGGRYLSLLIQNILAPVESSLNKENLSGVLYMESVYGSGGLPVEWVLLSSWFKSGSHLWFTYYPCMWPFCPSFDRTLYMWFYDAQTQKMYVFNKFHWKEIDDNGTVKFTLDGENTLEHTKVSVSAKVLATQTNVFQIYPFFLHKYLYMQMPSMIEQFKFSSPEFNRTIADLGQPAGYAEKSSLTGFNLRKEYSN